ncbi:MAG: sulfatase [bacterium]
MKEKRPNVILVTVDSLRADHLGCYGYSKSTSPNLDRLAEESYLFTNAFSNGPNTPHAFPAIMASRYSLMSNRFGLFDAPVTMAEILKSAGYTTAGFIAANPWISRYFQYQRGFDIFEDFIDFISIAGNLDINSEKQHTLFQKSLDGMANIAKTFIPENTNIYQLLEHWKVFLKGYSNIHHSLDNKRVLLEKFYNKFFNWIDANTQFPFFLWVHLMDTHYPYNPLNRFIEELKLDGIDYTSVKKISVHLKYRLGLDSKTLQQALNLYDGTIREVDFQLGLFFDLLKSKGLFEESIIVFTADHGEEFNAHNGLLHTAKLYDELIHVPLLIKVPEYAGGTKIDSLISHLDLLPTLCRLLNLEYGTDKLLGNSFEKSLTSRLAQQNSFVLSETIYDEKGEVPIDESVFYLQTVPKLYGLRTFNWKLIHDSKNGPTHLFNLKQDPKEEVNLIRNKRNIALGLNELLQVHIKQEYKNLLNTKISLIKDNLKSST